jgi:hypothetical protein
MRRFLLPLLPTLAALLAPTLEARSVEARSVEARPVWAPAAGAHPPAPWAVATPTQDAYAEFLKRFRDAQRVGDRNTMQRLFKSEQPQAIWWIIDTAMRMGSEPSEALAKDMQLQKETWWSAFETRFADKMERFYAFLRPQAQNAIRSMAVDATEVSSVARGLLADQQAERRIERIKDYRERAKGLALRFEELGDRYFAGEMWFVAGECSGPDHIPDKEADLGLALEAFGKFLEHRDEIELVDNLNQTAEDSIKRFEALGAVAGAGAGPTASIEVGSSASAPGAPEIEDKVSKLERPCYLTDEVYLTWNAIWVPGMDGEVTFPRMDKSGVRVKRTGAASIQVIGSDGSTADVSLNNTIQLVRTVVGRGDEQREWAFLVADPGTQEYFNTVPMNMAAGAEGQSLYVAPAASQVFEVGGEAVRVFDDDIDGVFGGPGQGYVWPGMQGDKGEQELQFDSMLVGKSKRAVPFSRLVQIADQWYQLEPEYGGKIMRHAPVTLRTGTLELQAKGADFAWYVVEGLDELAGVRFDLAQARRGVTVPVGRYRLISAGLRAGKRADIMKATVAPPLGEDAGVVFVAPDAEAAFVAGAPYGFDFKAYVEGDELAIDGESVVVVGAGGERYHRIWNARNEPDVELRKPGSGRGTKVGSLKAVWTTQEIIDVGPTRAWKPLDARVPNRFGAAVEIRLLEKNNLFGKIESDWKPPVE